MADRLIGDVERQIQLQHRVRSAGASEVLATVQRKAALHITGGMCISPTDHLNVHADLHRWASSSTSGATARPSDLPRSSCRIHSIAKSSTRRNGHPTDYPPRCIKSSMPSTSVRRTWKRYRRSATAREDGSVTASPSPKTRMPQTK